MALPSSLLVLAWEHLYKHKEQNTKWLTFENYLGEMGNMHQIMPHLAPKKPVHPEKVLLPCKNLIMIKICV